MVPQYFVVVFVVPPKLIEDYCLSVAKFIFRGTLCNRDVPSTFFMCRLVVVSILKIEMGTWSFWLDKNKAKFRLPYGRRNTKVKLKIGLGFWTWPMFESFVSGQKVKDATSKKAKFRQK